MTRQTQLSEDFLALNQVLPVPATWSGCSIELWNQIEVRQDKIELDLQNRSRLLAYLRRIPVKFQRIIALKCELDPYNLPSDQESDAGPLVEMLANEYLSVPYRRWLTDIVLLNEFARNKYSKSIRKAVDTIIGTPSVRDCELYFGNDEDAIRLALCSIAYFRDPSSLTLIYLYERAERFGYSRYRLVTPDFGNTLVKRANAITTLNINDVEKALENVDQMSRMVKISRCLGIHEEGGKITVFVKRLFREDRIVEVDRTIFGDQADPIVLRFSDSLNQLEERSVQQISKAPAGKIIADAIASLLLGKGPFYERVVPITQADNLARFLTMLETGTDNRLYLHELVLPQAPIHGQPQLSLKGYVANTLPRSLNDLAQKGLVLLNDPTQISRLLVVFRSENNLGKPTEHQFTLHIRALGADQFSLTYSHGPIGTEERDAFEAYIKKQYIIYATPRTSRGR